MGGGRRGGARDGGGEWALATRNLEGESLGIGGAGSGQPMGLEMGFAAVSAAEARALALSPAQRTAIEKLTCGHTLVDSATAAGVNRTTLYRWLKSDAQFQAAYNAWQQDALATARARMLGLTDVALTSLGKAM